MTPSRKDPPAEADAAASREAPTPAPSADTINFDNLPPEEAALLELYRGMNAVGQATVLSIGSRLANETRVPTTDSTPSTRG